MQVAERFGEGAQMALTGDKDVFGRVPAGDMQQFFPQKIDAFSASRRQVDPHAVSSFVPLGVLAGKINLVVHDNSRRSRRQPGQNGFAGLAHTLSRIDEQQHHIGFFDLLSGAGDVNPFDFIAGVAQSGRVDDVQRDPFDL